MKPEDLTKWRTDRNLTMEALGNLLGVKHATISRWETPGKKGRRIPFFLPLALSALKVKKGGKKKEGTKKETERKVKK
jgi:transcriptional regulator with XRE-family HTH domain